MNSFFRSLIESAYGEPQPYQRGAMKVRSWEERTFSPADWDDEF